jgi:AraC-like DNA-binding protein
MSAQPESLSDLPAREDAAQRVRDGLRCLQLSGAIFLLAQFTAPWAYESADEASFHAMVKPRGRRVIVFHIFTEGQAIVGLRGEQVDVEPGDVVILPNGDQHSFGHPSLRNATRLRRLWPPQPWSAMTVIRHGGGGPRTSMVCGYLLSDDVPLNPVLGSLPALMRVRPRGGPLARWVQASVDYALHAAGRQPSEDDPLLQRLPELLFTECLCEFAATDPDAKQGWLAGLQDPAVGKALAGMHREPQSPWTLDSLAKRAGASRSVLDQRFRKLLGKAPMAYLAAWRVQLAARELRTTSATLAEIAEGIGYGTEASFSKAFKRHAGVSPGEWRAQQVATAR